MYPIEIVAMGAALILGACGGPGAPGQPSDGGVVSDDAGVCPFLPMVPMGERYSLFRLSVTADGGTPDLSYLLNLPSCWSRRDATRRDFDNTRIYCATAATIDHHLGGVVLGFRLPRSIWANEVGTVLRLGRDFEIDHFSVRQRTFPMPTTMLLWRVDAPVPVQGALTVTIQRQDGSPREDRRQLRVVGQICSGPINLLANLRFIPEFGRPKEP